MEDLRSGYLDPHTTRKNGISLIRCFEARTVFEANFEGSGSFLAVMPLLAGISRTLLAFIERVACLCWALRRS